MTNDWHAKTEEEILAELNTDRRLGLSAEEHKKRLRKYGHNIISETKKFRKFRILADQLKNPLALILITAGVIAALLNEWHDTLVILIAVIINTAVGFFQEYRADEAFEKLRSSVKKYAIVIRDGHETQVESSMLVPGDLIIVRSGDGIGADARIIESKNLSVNEAVITGEWMPSDKSADIIAPETHFAERHNMLWMGTAAVDGWGKAVVVATGDKTEFGKIAKSLETTEEPAPFQKGIKHLARIIGGVVIAVAFAIFAVGIWRGEEAAHMFLMAVAISVAAVPEGLPIATTVILAVGMGRILAKSGLVKNLNAAETLGSTSIILTDKTGTLTKAEMQVSDIIVPEEIGLSRDEKRIFAARLKAIETAVLSADAFIENPDADLKDWVIRGKPTEKAIFAAGMQAGLHPHDIQTKNLRLDFFPFDAERRMAASLNSVDGHSQISAAGAPEKILAVSSWIEIGGNTVSISEETRDRLAETYRAAVSRGSRVLGIAKRLNSWQALPKDHEEIFREFVFLGLIAFHDPLRSDAKHAIKEAKAAGLRAILMTGDHKSTATAIGLEAGLFTEDGRNIIDGDELEKMDNKMLDARLESISGYARVLPHQKMRIVDAWQKRGEVVAMTGDGVNDAPALKRADIGIALGSGTDVAKESSDLVLINDSFSVIIAAIEEGRVILDNLRKIVTFLLATGFTEVVLVSGALLFGLPLPILPAQILWSNLVGEGFMNFAFAFEPKEADIMRRDPKKHSSKKIMTKEMFWIIFGIGILTDIFLFILFLFFWNLNYPLEKIRTIVFAGLAVDSLFFVYSIKSLRRPIWKINILSNKYLLFASAASVAMLAMALTLPPLKSLLSLESLALSEVAVIISLGFLDLAAIESIKYYFLSRQKPA